MKAEELRIGNLIMLENDLLPETKGEIYKVAGFQSRFDLSFPDSTGVIFLDHIKSIRTYNQFDEFVIPIPLTEEWLLKLGFDPEEDGYVHPEEPLFIIDSDLSHIWDASYTGAKIDNIHQLQNLFFALTGNELTINENSL
jgi:hypothetical protein